MFGFGLACWFALCVWLLLGYGVVGWILLFLGLVNLLVMLCLLLLWFGVWLVSLGLFVCGLRAFSLCFGVLGGCLLAA